MSSIRKNLQIVLGVVFILTTGTISVTAQTPAAAAANSSSTKPPADVVSTTEPKKAELVKPPAIAEGAVSEKTSRVSGDVVNEDSLKFAGAPTAVVTAPTLSNAEVPRNPQAADSDKWQFQFSPYFWMAGLHGTGGTASRTTSVDESFSDVFDVLNFAFMATFEARKGKFISLTDVEYVSVSDEKATPGPLFSTVDAGFKTFIFDQEVGYRLYENPDTGASVDVLGGARIWRVKTDFEFGAGILPAVRLEGSRSWVDAVGGLRGKAPLSQKFFVTGKFDLGGGGSKFTWQLFGGGGYSINQSVALIFGYRVLDVNYDKNNFVYDMNQRGPIMGVGFKF